MFNQVVSKVIFFFMKTWQFFASVVVVFVVFLSQFHDFKSPDIVLEVTSVKATSSQPVELEKFPELSSLKDFIGNDYRTSIFSITRGTGYSPEEIDRILFSGKSRIVSMGEEIDRAERKLGAAMSGTDKKYILESLRDLGEELLDRVEETSFFGASYRRVSKVEYGDSSVSVDEEIESTGRDIKRWLESRRKKKDSINAKYKEANRQWLDFKLNVMPSRTKLVIVCAIGNQGSGATSLKPQALFRANLGEGNYLDFPMKISDYDSSPEAATLDSHSYKVVRFESDEIQSMTAADRERFKAFLGNASPARIFISDVRGDVYASNSVPFSPGVYEQKMFDSLKQFASSKKSL